MIVTMFPEPREQAKAIGVYAFVASAGGSVGLLAGGVLTQAINWHWIFFVNVPIGVVDRRARAAPARAATRASASASGADVLGAVLITGALMLSSTRSSSRPPRTAGARAARSRSARVALALLAAFIVREATAAQRRSIPLRIFRSRNVAGREPDPGAASSPGCSAMFFLGALYLQRVLGYDPLEIGLAFLPATIVMGALSLRYSERLIMRFGARRTLVPGLVLIAGRPAAVHPGAGRRRLRRPTSCR